MPHLETTIRTGVYRGLLSVMVGQSPLKVTCSCIGCVGLWNKEKKMLMFRE